MKFSEIVRSDCLMNNDTSKAEINRLEHEFQNGIQVMPDQNSSIHLDNSAFIRIPRKPISIGVVNGMFRITVVGFELDKESTDIESNPTFTCCLCMEKTDSTNIVLHCKQHEFLDLADNCRFCSLRFEVSELEKHLTSHRLFLEPVMCDNLKQFTTGSKFHQPLRQAISDFVVGKMPVFKCSKCKKLFLAENDLEIHANDECIKNKSNEKSLESLPITHKKSDMQIPISYRPVEVFKMQDDSYRVVVLGFVLCSNGNDEVSQTFKCCLCLQMINPTNMVSHLKSHFPLETSECKFCSTKCNSINELKKHLNGHSYTLIGLICQDLTEFEKKMSAKSTNPAPVADINADDSMTRSKELECLIPIFTCKDCSKIILDYKDLDNHKKEHEKDNEEEVGENEDRKEEYEEEHEKHEEEQEEMCPEDLNLALISNPMEILLETNNEIKVVVNGFIMGNENNKKKFLNSKHKCCICLKEVSSINIAWHCESHYPLKATDYCQVCCLHFESTSSLENHLIDHKLVLSALPCNNMSEFNAKLAEMSSKNGSYKLLAATDIGGTRNAIQGCMPGFKCNLCGIIFLIERKLENHTQSAACVSYVQPIEVLKESETDIELAIYGYCLASISDGTDEISSYICCICLDVLKCKTSILLHYKLHYPLRVTDTCKLCSFDKDSVCLLEAHLKEHSVLLNVMDLAASTASCSGELMQAISDFLNASDLQLTDFSNQSDLLKCFVCEFLCTDECMFKKHFKSGKCIKFTSFACRRCGRNFNAKQQLYSHVRTAHCCMYSLCHICGNKVKFVHMRRHIRTRHEKKESILLKQRLKNVTCEVCGVSVSKYAFDQHFATHSFSRKFVCNLCNKTFHHKYSYIVHLKSHVPSAKKISCEICSATFKYNCYLVRHKATKHNISSHIFKARDYKCDVCSKQFFTANSLLLHKKTHLELQNFECLQCKAIFSSGLGVKQHQTLTKHEGVDIFSSATDKSNKVNRYACKICGQRYRTAKSLKIHENFHNDTIKTNI